MRTQVRVNAESNCCCCGLTPRRDAPSALQCAKNPSVRAHADYLWSGGEETCGVRYRESTCLGIRYFTMCLTAAAATGATAVVYEYVSRRSARRVRFSWSLGPSPSQPTVVWPRREAPPADCASGAKQRRYSAVSPSNTLVVLLLLAVVGNILTLETMPFFDLKI